MAIASYPSLKSALQTYAVRPDTTFGNQVPTFVQLAESRMYNGSGEAGDELYTPPLRSGAMEVTATVTMTSGVGALPTNALEVRKLYVSGQKTGITYQTPERWAELNENASAGTPVFYTIDAGSIKTTPAHTGNLLVTYFRKFDEISDTNATGEMILAHGDLYLEACLFEAFSFLQEPTLAIGHLAKYRGLLAGANRTAGSMRYPGPLRVRTRGLVFP